MQTYPPPQTLVLINWQTTSWGLVFPSQNHSVFTPAHLQCRVWKWACLTQTYLYPYGFWLSLCVLTISPWSEGPPAPGSAHHLPSSFAASLFWGSSWDFFLWSCRELEQGVRSSQPILKEETGRDGIVGAVDVVWGWHGGSCCSCFITAAAGGSAPSGKGRDGSIHQLLFWACRWVKSACVEGACVCPNEWDFQTLSSLSLPQGWRCLEVPLIPSLSTWDAWKGGAASDKAVPKPTLNLQVQEHHGADPVCSPFFGHPFWDPGGVVLAGEISVAAQMSSLLLEQHRAAPSTWFLKSCSSIKALWCLWGRAAGTHTQSPACS